MDTKLANGVFWVGCIDWNIRDFHGYETEGGSTYNSYLVKDSKIALIDTVKEPFAKAYLESLTQHIKLEDIDYVICNHAEPDHSGSLPQVMKACSRAELVCDKKCREALSLHYDTKDWRFRIVQDGEIMSLGTRNLQFFETPMSHWPESMATYLPEEKLLFSMDVFGQHIALSTRFDDDDVYTAAMAEAKKYYANILMLYGKPNDKLLTRLSTLPINTLAPSHGVIWRKHTADIVNAYKRWAVLKPEPKVLVIYDTMWKSTEKMAYAILEGALSANVCAKLLYVRANTLATIADEVLDTAAMAVGSPTLNTTLMSQMAAVLTYLKGLRPVGKAAFAFGSYGWGKGGADAVGKYLTEMNLEVIREPLQTQFVPNAEVLTKCREAGLALAQRAIELSQKAK